MAIFIPLVHSGGMGCSKKHKLVGWQKAIELGPMVILLLVSWTRDMLLEAKLRSSSCSWQMECVGTKWMTVLFFFHILRYLDTSIETMIQVQIDNIQSHFVTFGGWLLLSPPKANSYPINESFVSSVRSSNSHPDLLVTLNHFFRSHRSSTLDFHFLSHYSYIKAIKLYKGNHWIHLLATCIPNGYNRASLMTTFWFHSGYILAKFGLYFG